MEKKNKTRSEYILDALMTGKSLLPGDIARMVSDASGEETKIQAISTLIVKLSNSWAFPIGHFINKNKTAQGYEYSLVPEILNLTTEEIYGLTRQTGKDRFTLKMALEKIPELGKYVQKAIKRKTEIKEPPVDTKTAAMKPAKKSATSQKETPVRKLVVKSETPALEAEPKPPEPEIQAATVEDVVAIFLNEIEKIGGLKVNVNLNVRRRKG